MLRLLFGLNEDDDDFAELLRFYRQFGPEAPVYSIGQDQAAAYAEIERRVRRLAEDIRRNPSEHLPSFLRLMVERGELDETAIGNLIYMFEPAHFDMYSLWRWVLKHLASNTDIMDRVQKAFNHQVCGQLCEAIVLETLRLEQSELLYRAVRSDITYEFLFYPQGHDFEGLLVGRTQGSKRISRSFPGLIRIDLSDAPIGLTSMLHSDWTKGAASLPISSLLLLRSLSRFCLSDLSSL